MCENPLILIVITPIMLRTNKRNFAQEIVFIDSSGSCDQTNTSATLACILHIEQSVANYTLVFSLLREKLGTDGFGGYGFPNVIMTDDSLAEKNSAVFPEANLWLWNSHNGISKDHRKIIMTEFQRLLYSVCEEDAEEIYQEFLQNKIHLLYGNFVQYIRNMWERKTEWILCFRTQLVTRGNDTNNFAEDSIRIFKDIVFNDVELLMPVHWLISL